jgi:hypothetical protein
VIQIPPAMITIPTRMIATSIVSHIGIRFEGFMVLRLLSPGTWWTRAAQVEVRWVTLH